MSPEEIRNSIAEQVQLQVQSKTQNNDHVIRDIQSDVKNLSHAFHEFKHNDEEYRRNHNESHKELKKSIDGLATDAKPVMEWFKNINFLKSVIMWILGLIIAAGAAFAVVKGYLAKLL